MVSRKKLQSSAPKMYPQSKIHGLPEAKTTPAKDELKIEFPPREERNHHACLSVSDYNLRASGYQELGIGENLKKNLIYRC